MQAIHVSSLTPGVLAVKEFLTTREVAESLPGITEWQIRRCYELHLLPDPPRFGGKRAVPAEHFPLLVDALCKRGWLSEEEPVTA